MCRQLPRGEKVRRKEGKRDLGHRRRTGGANKHGGISETMLHSLWCVYIFSASLILPDWDDSSTSEPQTVGRVHALLSCSLRFTQVKHLMFLRASDFSVCPPAICQTFLFTLQEPAHAYRMALHLHGGLFCFNASLVAVKLCHTWAARSRDP